MEQIYKINHLSFNDKKTQFCLCYNNGIKNFSSDDFKEKYESNTIGAISLAVLLHELNMVIFVGTENNEEYNNKKIVSYDLINHQALYSTPFPKEIISLKSTNKYLIIGFEYELKIFSLEKKDTIIPIKEIILPESNLYEMWDKSSYELISLIKIYLIYPFGKDICICSYVGNEWNLDRKYDYKSPSKKIQNFFYIEKLNNIFISDEDGRYIYGINPENGKQDLCLYRGNDSGIITSITLLNKKYLAVNNYNKTIHIFDINTKSNSNIYSLIGGFFYGDYISSIIKIKYEELIKEKEGESYESDFTRNGAILASEEDGIYLTIIAYNGYAYKLKINFLKKDYDLILKENLTEQNAIEKNESSIEDSGIEIVK
jgi:hypothetical protein